ncbi:unnamed protein product [Paramecium sonneborni]|uniref:Uncharacterized protein n=1 Tax=Paramecium sonneborni TaxID=65129 RepID=A0A8S1RUX5_9CILI|nr:unnamed protein product [Paramecium sonneborni]
MICRQINGKILKYRELHLIDEQHMQRLTICVLILIKQQFMEDKQKLFGV